MHHTTAEVPLMPLGHESVPGTLCIQNVLATAHQTAGATLAGAPPTARLSKCTISSVTRAWSGMTTLKPRQRSTHVLEHAQTHHGIPLHTKDARNSTSDSARNSRARHPARPSKCTISSTVRARSRLENLSVLVASAALNVGPKLRMKETPTSPSHGAHSGNLLVS